MAGQGLGDTENVFKILIGIYSQAAACGVWSMASVCKRVSVAATDNHVGYLEKDQVRGSDSLEAFEEVLKIAQDREASEITVLRARLTPPLSLPERVWLARLNESCIALCVHVLYGCVMTEHTSRGFC